MTTVLASLNHALRRSLAADRRVILMGEDILDPYGGAFKVTRGLSTEFPEQVLTTPVSEAGIVGLAAGMALRGLRPVVEIMFGDFTTLIADQLINGAAKFRWMYDQQVEVPLVVRTPMGGRRGYGPTHSQTLEKLFLGVPGLQVLAPSALGDPGGLLEGAIFQTTDPVLFVENKLLYQAEILGKEDLTEFSWQEHSPSGDSGPLAPPTITLALHGAPPATLTMTAYGHAAELARQAALELAYQHEVFVELVIPTGLTPFCLEPLLESVGRTGQLLVFEEGNRTLGWGAEVLAQTSEALGPALRASQRLAAADTPIPASGPLEAVALPGVEALVGASLQMA